MQALPEKASFRPSANRFKNTIYRGVAQLVAREVWETDLIHSGLFPKTSSTPLTLRIFGLWDFRKNRQKWQRPHSIPQTLKTPQKLNIGMWRSLVSRSLWEREISQVRILSSRPLFLRSRAVPEDFYAFSLITAAQILTVK